MPEGVQRRGKRYRARYRNPETGKQVEKSFAKQSQAVKWRREGLASIDSGRWVNPAAGRVSFEAYFDQWAERQVWTDGTRKAMSLAGRSTTFRDLELRTIRATHVEVWIKAMTIGSGNARGRPLAPSTVRTRFVNVRGVFRAAVRDELIARDPTERLTLPRQRKREASMAIPTPEQVALLLEAADERFEAFVAVCALAGLRLGEAAALRRDDIDFLRRRLYVRRQVQRVSGGKVEIRLPKYNSERTVPLPDQLLDVLSAHMALGHAGEWLFAGAEQDPPHQNTVGHRWRTICRRANVEGFRLHDLRHFFASGLIASGCDVVTVQRALGHASASTTLTTYSHLWPSAEDRTRDAAAALAGQVLAPREGTSRAETL